LWQPGLAEKIKRSLRSVGLDSRRVLIEITESTAMAKPFRTQRILEVLHGDGVRVAIDDFGTGYSSLSRLKDLPVDVLKIDRSFINDLPDDPDASSMVKTMIQMASNLGMTPLAEGIETRAQWQFLVENGCRQGQGFFFSRPVPADQIRARYPAAGALGDTG
jgi:EAL domain-containing protein (putative c-di-GMP-specific phosphodiesterase class I)